MHSSEIEAPPKVNPKNVIIPTWLNLMAKQDPFFTKVCCHPNRRKGPWGRERFTAYYYHWCRIAWWYHLVHKTILMFLKFIMLMPKGHWSISHWHVTDTMPQKIYIFIGFPSLRSYLLSLTLVTGLNEWFAGNWQLCWKKMHLISGLNGEVAISLDKCESRSNLLWALMGTLVFLWYSNLTHVSWCSHLF